MALQSGIRIEGLFLGNTFELLRSVVGIPSGRKIARGEVYLKNAVDDENSQALVFIQITVVDSPQFGQVTDDGDGDAVRRCPIESAQAPRVAA